MAPAAAVAACPGDSRRCTFAARSVLTEAGKAGSCSWSWYLASDECRRSEPRACAAVWPEPVLPVCATELASERRRLREVLSSTAGDDSLCSMGAAWRGLPSAGGNSGGCALAVVLCLFTAADVAAAAAAGGVSGSEDVAARCGSGRRQRSWQKRLHTWGAAAGAGQKCHLRVLALRWSLELPQVRTVP